MNATFWNKYKVFIIGILTAVAMVLQDYINTTEINWSTIGLAAGMAALSYIAKEWRGQGLTIFGFIGVAADTIVTLNNTGSLTWERAAMLFFIAIVTAAGADPKSRGYENTEVIKQAKAEGEAINPAALTTKPKA